MESFENIEVVFIKDDNFTKSKAILEKNVFYYQKNLSILKDYYENKELFLNNRHTKYGVKDTLDYNLNDAITCGMIK